MSYRAEDAAVTALLDAMTPDAEAAYYAEFIDWERKRFEEWLSARLLRGIKEAA